MFCVLAASILTIWAQIMAASTRRTRRMAFLWIRGRAIGQEFRPYIRVFVPNPVKRKNLLKCFL